MEYAIVVKTEPPDTREDDDNPGPSSSSNQKRKATEPTFTFQEPNVPIPPKTEELNSALRRSSRVTTMTRNIKLEEKEEKPSSESDSEDDDEFLPTQPRQGKTTSQQPQVKVKTEPKTVNEKRSLAYQKRCQKETEEERDKRLERRRLHYRANRAKLITPELKEADRQRKMEARLKETPELRERRLKYQRKYSKMVYSKESEQQRERRLKKLRERRAKLVSNETEEQREARLKKKREQYNRERKYNSTFDDEYDGPQDEEFLKKREHYRIKMKEQRERDRLLREKINQQKIEELLSKLPPHIKRYDQPD